MFTVETLNGDTWKKDRVYKVFDNAENRLYALYDQGVKARIIERHR